MERTALYTVPRMRLAWLGLSEYLRAFFWFVAVLPLFGVACLVWGDRLLQLVGVMALLWPLTLPGRAFLASSRASRLFARGVRAAWDERTVYFEGEDGRGMKLERLAVRDAQLRGDYLVLRTRRLGAVPIARAAFRDETQLAALRAWSGPDTVEALA